MNVSRARELDARWWIALGTLTGLVLRAIPIGATPLWRDELAQIAAATSPAMLDAIRQHLGAAPLDYFGTRLAIGIVGDPLIGARGWALIAGTLAIPSAFLAGRAWFGTKAGYAAMALVVFSPFLIYYATEARFYALAVTLALVNIWALGERRWIVYALSAAAGLLTIYSFVLVLAAGGAYLFWRREWRGLAGIAFAVLTFLPWAAFALPSEMGREYAWQRFGLLESSAYSLIALHGLGAPLIFGLSLAVLTLAGSVIGVRSWPPAWPLAVAPVAVMAGMWWTTNQAGYFWVPRQSILVLPMILLLGAAGWSTLRKRSALAVAGLYGLLLVPSVTVTVMGSVGMR